MATIKDVAQLAGVSTTTVSHVVNKTRFVAETTQLKVNAAIKQLNYSPNAVARGLRSNSTNTIGMLVTQSTNPFFAEVVDGVESYCYRQGYTLILCNTGGRHTKQHDYLRMLAEKRVDGILIMCSDIDEELESMLRSYQDIPTVVMDWGAEASNQVDRIIDNSELGGFLATEYLINQGHRQICCVSGPIEKNICRERIQGYRRALTTAGIDYRESYVFEGNFECDTAVQIASQILQLDPLPTAIFCLNDVMALGVMCHLQQNGINIPADISVIGYDNIDLSGYFSPPLTTIHQPKRRMGKTAVELLFERISSQTHRMKGFEMHPQLVIRQSVRNIG